MAQLTVITNGISSADIITAINANFVFLNALIANAATLVTIDNTMEGQVLVDNINDNFIELNAHAALPISLTTLSIGITGAVLNSLFTNMNIALGKGMDGDGYFLEYYFTNTHICTTRGDKILVFDGTDTLSLSLDNGATYPITKQVTIAEPNICYAYIFLNGTILFCTETKAYYSTDNLSTYQECTVLAINGSAFTPTDQTSFTPFNKNQYITINGIETLIWGSYTQGGANVNCWWTQDGLTIKSIYKVGTTIAGLNADHIHNVAWKSSDSTLWLNTGDGVNKCNWIKGTINLNTLAFTWELIVQGSDADYSKSVGFIFKDSDVYWGSDSTGDAAKYGIWKVPYNSIADSSSYTRESNAVNNVLYTVLSGDYNGEMVWGWYIKEVCIYHNGNFSLKTLVGGVNINYLTGMVPKNNQGYYKSDMYKSGDAVKDWTKGQVLMLRIVK